MSNYTMGPTIAQRVRFIKGVNRAIATQYTSLDNPGFCFTCGEETDGVEPDAKGYECPTCGGYNVYGLMHSAENELMSMGFAKKDLADRMSGRKDATAV